MAFSKLQSDLHHIQAHLVDIRSKLENKTLLVTGGTGFFGVWFHLAFIFLNETWGLNSRMLVLTRNKKKFFEKYPWIENRNVIYIEGDIVSFDFPPGPIDYIVHAATEASVALNLEEPILMFETIINGTKRVLDLAVEKKSESFLLTSSGAVYGVQPPEISHLPEDYLGGPNTISKGAMYGEAKRLAETLCASYYYKENLSVKIARCFAFVGPFLPLNTHFAVGNFLRDRLESRKLIVKGDGSPTRSYLHASDLIIWLFTILIRGDANSLYNVGSDQAVSIEQLARVVASLDKPSLDYEILTPPQNKIVQYVPDIRKAKRELSLAVNIDLKESLFRTYNFYKNS